VSMAVTAHHRPAAWHHVRELERETEMANDSRIPVPPQYTLVPPDREEATLKAIETEVAELIEELARTVN
jgi:hypothetical protein